MSYSFWISDRGIQISTSNRCHQNSGTMLLAPPPAPPSYHGWQLKKTNLNLANSHKNSIFFQQLQASALSLQDCPWSLLSPAIFNAQHQFQLSTVRIPVWCPRNDVMLSYYERNFTAFLFVFVGPAANNVILMSNLRQQDCWQGWQPQYSHVTRLWKALFSFKTSLCCMCQYFFVQ